MIYYDFTGNAKEENFRNDINIDFVKDIYKRKGTLFYNDLLSHGYIKILGYLYSFKDELKQYVVKQYGQWQEYYAPNKTLLRQNIYGKIDKIVEVK